MNGPHLDDEQLSASLDGEAGDDAAGHVAACTPCARRLEGLAAVRGAVAAPVSAGPPAGVVDRAVAAAVAAWEQERSPDRVVPLRPAAPPASVPGRAGVGHRRTEPDDRRRLPAWALAVAAVLAAVVAAVPVLSSLGGGDDADETAAARESAARTAADEVAQVDGGDLGDQSDAAALGRVLGQAVPAPAAESYAAPAPSAADDARTAAGAAPPAAQASSAPPAPATRVANPPCAAEVRSSFGRGLGPLLYTASLRWQGTPAVVLAYRLADAPEAAGGGLAHRAFVMSREGCQLLVVQGF